MLLFVKEKYKVITFDMQLKSILAIQYREWSEEQTPPLLTYTAPLPLASPSLYLSGRWREGLIKQEGREGQKQMSGRTQMWKKREKWTGGQKKKWWVGSMDKWGAAVEDRVGSHSITVFPLATISAWPAVIWIPCITSPTLWLVKEPGLSLKLRH